MNTKELANNLLHIGIPSNMYSINYDKDEHYCIVQNGILNKSWEVYYSQRNRKDDLRVFKNEDEACNYFLSWIRDDYYKYTLRKPLPSDIK